MSASARSLRGADRGSVKFTSQPIALCIDPGFELAPFAAALDGELSCRDRVTEDERAGVIALVTGAVAVGESEAADYPSPRVVLSCSTGTDHLDGEALSARGLQVR